MVQWRVRLSDLSAPFAHARGGGTDAPHPRDEARARALDLDGLLPGIPGALGLSHPRLCQSLDDAAVAAGARALAAEAGTHTAVLAVDAPESSGLLPELMEALDAAPGADVAVVREDSGHLQPMCAVWRTRRLHRVLDEIAADGGLSDQAAKLLLHRAEVVEIAGTGEERDYDTLADLADYGEVEE